MNRKYLPIGPRISKLRKDKGLTQEELADKLFTTQQAISLLEQDKEGNITFGRLIEVADSMDTDIAVLLGISGVIVNMENHESPQSIGCNYGTMKVELPVAKMFEQYDERIKDLKEQLAVLAAIIQGQQRDKQ